MKIVIEKGESESKSVKLEKRIIGAVDVTSINGNELDILVSLDGEKFFTVFIAGETCSVRLLKIQSSYSCITLLDTRLRGLIDFKFIKLHGQKQEERREIEFIVENDL